MLVVIVHVVSLSIRCAATFRLWINMFAAFVFILFGAAQTGPSIKVMKQKPKTGTGAALPTVTMKLNPDWKLRLRRAWHLPTQYDSWIFCRDTSQIGFTRTQIQLWVHGPIDISPATSQLLCKSMREWKTCFIQIQVLIKGRLPSDHISQRLASWIDTLGLGPKPAVIHGCSAAWITDSHLLGQMGMTWSTGPWRVLDGTVAFNRVSELYLSNQDCLSSSLVQELTCIACNEPWLNLEFLGTALSFEDLVTQAHQKIDHIIEYVLPSEEYYIGMTAWPPHRWKGGWHNGGYMPGHHIRWRKMFALMVHDGPVIGQLEVAVLPKYNLDKARCTNKGPGNEGCCPRGVPSFLYLNVLDARWMRDARCMLVGGR